MTDSLLQRSEQCAQTINSAASRSFNVDIDKLNATLAEAEVECLKISRSVKEDLEIKRRVIEWKLRLYCDRKIEFEDVSEFYSKLLDLGYSNVGVEVNMETYYADYLINIGKTDLAKTKLADLVERLSDASIDADDEWRKHMIGYSEKLIAKSKV